ncbi:hypothetical protein NPIL_114051 [Nephila pilipes]|uniref:Uncharacterized protein n=1 Tax=Nephila pilipes TaxID=299642 RepID=A0A8X6QF93_NEPPI|nr:hypothetical protein NPIL_114051 [Nephila pilipes]
MSGSKVTIVIDRDAFRRDDLSEIPDPCEWLLLLEEFPWEVVHKPGQQMKYVDASSRNVKMVICSRAEITTILKSTSNYLNS